MSTNRSSYSEEVPKRTSGLAGTLHAALVSSQSIAAVAAQAGVDRTTLQRFVTQQRGLSIHTAGLVLDALGYRLLSPANEQWEDTSFTSIPSAKGLVAFIDTEILPAKLLALSPVAVFCTDLETGEFQFVNKAFAAVFGFSEVRDTLSAYPNATELYGDSKQRRRWTAVVQESGVHGNFVATPISDLYIKNEHRRLSLAEVVRLIPFDGRDYALGFAIDVTAFKLQSETNQFLLEAFDQLFADPTLNVGLHTIARHGESAVIKGVTAASCRLLGVDGHWFNKIQSVADLTGDPDATKRAVGKLNGDRPLTDNGFRTFLDHSRSSPSSKITIPVVIHDFGIKDPRYAFENNRTFGPILDRILTSIRDARIPAEFVNILRQYGPRNPILENAGVQSFVKVCTNPEAREPDFEFQFANRKLQQRLVRRHKLKVLENGEIESIVGKREKELFEGFEYDFRQTDVTVYRTQQTLQQIEGHPSVESASIIGSPQVVQVHVIKIPHYDRVGHVIGVEGYFWEITEEAAVFERLRNAYQPWLFLDSIPIPVYRKSPDLRFTYANSAYLDDIKNVSPSLGLTSIRSIIGLSDKDLFDARRSSQYERDDECLLDNPAEPIIRIEQHGPYWVKVIKTAILSRSSQLDLVDPTKDVVAIQGVFWKLDIDEMREFLQKATGSLS